MVKKREGGSGNSSCLFRGRFCIIGVLAVFIFILQIVFVSTGVFSEHRSIIGNVFIVLLSFIALICVNLLYFKFPENFPAEKRGNLFLVFGVLFFFLGDLAWLISELFLGELVPIGGIPDFLWDIGYIMFIVAVVFFISISFRPSKKFLYWLLIIGVIAGGALLYQDVAEDLEEGSFTFAHAIQDMYMVYDIILIILIFYLAWPMVFVGNKLFYGMFILAFGFFTRVVYDRIFAEMSEMGTYFTGHPIDLLYVVFYLCIIFKSVYKMRILCNNG